MLPKFSLRGYHRNCSASMRGLDRLSSWLGDHIEPGVLHRLELETGKDGD